MREVNFGLIGYGLFGAHHASAIARTEGAQLRCISVPSDASRERASAAHPTARICTAIQELLSDKEIEVVSVVVPNYLHVEIGSAVLRAGKHLLLEKPMALSVDDCDALIRLAKEHDRILAIGHELRLSSLWGRMKELIDEGVIGDPLYALVELSRFPYRQGSGGWRYDESRVGNWVLEEPIHFFDLACWYMSSRGAPTKVDARANSRDASRPELTDNFSCIVDFEGSAYAVISQTLGAFGHHQTAKVTGTKGTIWARWSAADARSDRPTFSLTYGLGPDVHEVAINKPAGELLELHDEIRAIAECVRSGGQPPCTGADGRMSTLLCLVAQESIASNSPVRLDEFLANH